MRNGLKGRPGLLKSVISGVTGLTLLLYAAVFAGLYSGRLLSRYDINGPLGKVDGQVYQSMVSGSLPVVGYSYGGVSSHGPGALTASLEKYLITGFYYPVSVAAAQISGLYSCYLSAMEEETESTEIAEVSLNAENLQEPQETGAGEAFRNESPTLPLPEEGKSAIAEPAFSTKSDDANHYNASSRGMEEAASSISVGNDTEKEGPPTGKVEFSGKITIRNETRYKADIDALMKEPLKLKFDKKKDKILIYHTHTTESYIQKLSQLNSLVATHSRDTKQSVVRVGDTLADALGKSFKLKVVHNTTLHDYPDFNKSYVNSLKTVKTVLAKDPNIKMVLDIHRNAAGNNEKLREAADINGKTAAKIMFVVATGEVKQNHSGWKENFKLALKLQEKLLEQCPQLTQPIFLSKNTFNQHVSNGALLVEIGGDGNLVEECMESAKYLAKAINDVILYN